MSYKNFSFAKAKQMFQLKTVEDQNFIPANVPEVNISRILEITLNENIPLAIAIGTEKARSELIIAPILVQVRKIFTRQISLFSGTEFNIDSELGLAGVCDFILSKSNEQLSIEAPVVIVVEAKKADLNSGMGQVTTQMVAAQMFNREQDLAIPGIYGCITNGTQWRFLYLEDQILTIELRDIDIQPYERIVS
ncbi:MAG: hypothetical protein ACRDBG_16735, partial [Waterburya sp.]